VRVEAALDTSKMRIGEQVKIDLYVSYNSNEKNVKIQWPSIGDTLTQKVEVVSASGIDTTLPAQSNSTKVFQHQQITVSVYDSGYYAIPGFRFIVNGDTVRPLYTNPLLLEVHTVPTDTSAAKIKDIKTVLGEPFSWKWYLSYIYWSLAALILIAAIVLLAIYFRRKKRQLPVEPPKPKIPPHITALQSLEQIRAEQVWKEGRAKEYYSSISDTVRLYIEERFGVNALESTTDEIMMAFRSQVVDDESKNKLRQLLSLSDLVKFAKLQPVEPEHLLTLQNAFDFVNTTKREEVIDESQLIAGSSTNSSTHSHSLSPASPHPDPAPRPSSQPETSLPPAQPFSPAAIPTSGEPQVTSAPDGKSSHGKFRTRNLILIASGLIGAAIGYLVVDRIFFSKPDFNELLLEYSAQMNRQCPLYVDRETRLDSTVVLPGRVFQYNYTLVRTAGEQVDKRMMSDQLEAGIFANVRNNPAMSLQRDNEVTMEYVYYDKDGKYMFNIRVRPQDY
jgi:hypothetical protein